jgi:hypothetical protein
MPVADNGPTGFDGIGQAPVIARQFKEFVLAKIAFQQKRIAEFARRQSPFSHLNHSGLKTPFVSDAQAGRRPCLTAAMRGFGIGTLRRDTSRRSGSRSSARRRHGRSHSPATLPDI